MIYIDVLLKKDDFEMREVEMEHLKQFNELLRYVFQVTTSELKAIGWKAKEMEQEKRPVLEKAHVLGWFDQDKLISQIAIYPMKVNIHGRIFEMGGVTGIGTYPEYASYGLAKALIFQALLDMKNKKQTISYLFPYSIPYYRKKGWEIISDKMSFTIADSQLPAPVDVDGMVRRVETEHDDIIKVYYQYAKQHHGALIRGKLEWQEYWRWDNDDIIAAIYYNLQNEPTGYLLYQIENDEFIVKEIISLSQEARKGIWNFISAHQSMIKTVTGNQFKLEPIAFLLDDGEITETIRPYFMARIVDVFQFLEDFPFQPFREALCFKVTDPLLDFNNDYFTITYFNDKISVERTKSNEHIIECDIQTLTTMLMNYKRPHYLNKIERLVTDRETLAILEKVIPDNNTYFSDYF